MSSLRSRLVTTGFRRRITAHTFSKSRIAVVNVTVIKLNDDKDWLFVTATLLQPDCFIHRLPMGTTLFHAFVAELRESHDVADVVFLTDCAPQLTDACFRRGLACRYEHHENHNSVERFF